MIRIVFLEEGDRLIGFEARGHAGYAEYGADIVCAAVSGILITAANGLEKVACAPTRTQQDDDTGLLTAVIAANPEEKALERAGVILETARLGLLEIEKQYPDFVRVHSQRRR